MRVHVCVWSAKFVKVCTYVKAGIDDVAALLFILPTIAAQMLKRELSITEGWEYARTVFSSYHVSEHKLDFARRRRWHRKLVQVSGDKPPVFYFDDEVTSVYQQMCTIV